MLQPQRCAASAPQLPPPLRSCAGRPRRVRRCVCVSSASTAAAVSRAAAALRSSPETTHVLALDIGTTGVKAACVARSGRLVATAEAAYAHKTHAPAPGRAEQAPADWLAAAGEAATRCIAALPPVRSERAHAYSMSKRLRLTFALLPTQGGGVVAVALCGQMQTLTLVGRAPGQLARGRALLYSDARASTEASFVDAALAAAPGAASSNLVGAGGGSVPAKLLWLAAHEPACMRDAAGALLGAHSVVAWALTGGAAAADATSASASGVLAPGGAAYAAAALERAGVDAAMLPPLLPPDAALGVVAACGGRIDAGDADDVAPAFAFPASLAGVPLFHGAGDVAATAAGAGGGTHLYLGTSGWAARVAPDDGAPPPPGVFQLAATEPGFAIHAAAATTSGGAVEWARAAFFGAFAIALSDCCSQRSALTHLA